MGEKRNVTLHIKICLIELDGKPFFSNLKIFPLISYDALISMNWLETRRAIVNFMEKTVTYVPDNEKI